MCWLASSRSSRYGLSLLAVVLFSARVSGQQRLFSFAGAGGVARAGDVDRDGWADVVVSQPARASNLIQVRSGRHGDLLFEVRARDHTLATGRDIDGDGFPDIVFRAPDPVVFSRIVAFSGKKRMVLWSVPETSVRGRLEFAGDLDRDRVPEVITGSRVYSGKTGKLIRDYRHLQYHEGLVGDVDGDGHPDAAHRWSENRTQNIMGIRSGHTGWNLLERRVSYGRATAAGVGDLNADGRMDYVITTRHLVPDDWTEVVLGPDKVIWRARRAFANAVRVPDVDRDGFADLVFITTAKEPKIQVEVVSGKTGKLIRKFDPPAGASSGFGQGAPGQGLAYLGDVNRDGAPDIGVDDNTAGWVWVISVTPPSLTSTTYRVDAGTGGTQELMLNAGRTQGEQLALVLGSLSGAVPGIQIGQFRLPLNPDAYTLLGVGNPLLSPSVVRLSGGRGKTTLRVPPLGRLRGALFDHAYLVFDASGRVTLASNSVPLALR